LQEGADNRRQSRTSKSTAFAPNGKFPFGSLPMNSRSRLRIIALIAVVPGSAVRAAIPAGRSQAR
jgi:hypothetical protein